MAGNINEESLIILVQEHECLYNLAHRDYDNNFIKDNIWKDIARSLSTTVDVCKNKWTLLRGYYRRALQRRKTKSGQSAKNIKKWRFEAQMEFLKPHLVERDTHSNLPYSQNTLVDEEVEDDTENQENDYSQSQVVDEDSISNVPSPALSVEARPSTSKETTPFRTKVAKTARLSSDTSSRYSKRKAPHETDNLSHTLSNFIKFRQSESSKKAVTDTEPPIPAKKRNLLNFFDDLAETILSFPELEQAEMKRDIFNLVNKKQIELLRRARELPLQETQNSYYPQVNNYASLPPSTVQAQSVYNAGSHENAYVIHNLCANSEEHV